MEMCFLLVRDSSELQPGPAHGAAVDPSAPAQLVGSRQSVISLYPAKAHPHWGKSGLTHREQSLARMSRMWQQRFTYAGDYASAALRTGEKNLKNPWDILQHRGMKLHSRISSQDPFPSGIWSHMCSHRSPRNPMPRRESFL